MALSHVANSAMTPRVSSWVTIAIPGTAAAGDLMVAMVALKPYTQSLGITAGWTALGNIQSGTTASGANAGSVRVAMWWKIHDGSESSPAIDSTNTGEGCIQVYRKAASEVFSLVWMGGAGDEAVNASKSVNATIDPIVIANDIIIVCYGTCSGDAWTAQPPTITVPGCTMGTAANSPGHASTTVGDNIVGGGYRRPVSSGISTGFANVSGTLTSTVRMGAAFARVRAFTPPPRRHPYAQVLAQ